MKIQKELVDTTLRDGEQSPGYAMTLRQKVKIAAVLDSAGVDQIEAGIPAIGPYERDTIREIVHRKRNSRISVWCRMNPDDIRAAFRCRPDLIHIGVPVSYVQIYSKLRRNKNWLMKTMLTCVDLALSNDFEVSVGFEDASRADPTFLITLADELLKAGVRRIRYADTVGVLSPSRAYQSVRELIRLTGAEVEMHAHNDLGMAVANSIAAAKAGASFIDTTVFGIGERAGNCNLIRFVRACEPVYSICPGHAAAAELERKTRDIILKKREDGSYETWN
ncbi:MAG: homocitrate synthase [Oscillospiraceae bacterium]|jgi:homocitrate synthase NifV|nr:homocitrate synthase [Oscillospiraceae bacterium]MCI2035751.1 homocitrate synthase [Oscillospiraceae bacterium]